METLAMSKKERRRLELFNRVRDGDVTLLKVLQLLGPSDRQSKRSFARYRLEGELAGAPGGISIGERKRAFLSVANRRIRFFASEMPRQ